MWGTVAMIGQIVEDLECQTEESAFYSVWNGLHIQEVFGEHYSLLVCKTV